MTESEEKFYSGRDSGDEWATPPRIWRPLAEALDGFTLDPASGCEPIPIADERFEKEDNGLAQDWHGDVFLNPPYGREHNEKWAKKAASEAQRDEVETLTALVPASVGAAWYQNNYGRADIETLIDGRVTFLGEQKNPAPFYSILVTWGDVPEQYVTVLHQLGIVREALPDPDRTEQLSLTGSDDGGHRW